MSPSALKAILLVSFVLFFSAPNRALALGKEGGGGHPAGVQFQLWALQNAQLGLTCRLASELIAPYSIDELIRVIKETSLRFTDEELKVNGGIVLARVENDPNSPRGKRIAVNLPQWTSYIKKREKQGNNTIIPDLEKVRDMTELSWLVWNLHEYLRVLGLSERDDVYDISQKFIEALFLCGGNPDKAPSFKVFAVDFVLDTEIMIADKMVIHDSSLAKPQTEPTTTADPDPVYSHAEFEESCKKTLKKAENELQRRLYAWNHNERVQAEQEIRDQFPPDTIIAMGVELAEDHAANLQAVIRYPSSRTRGVCLGARAAQRVTINAIVDSTFDTSSWRYKEDIIVDKEYKDVADRWDGTAAGALKIVNDIKNQVNVAIADSEVACSEWKEEMKSIFQQSMLFATCGRSDVGNRIPDVTIIRRYVPGRVSYPCRRPGCPSTYVSPGGYTEEVTGAKPSNLSRVKGRVFIRKIF